MKLRMLKNILKQGLQGVNRNRSMSFVSILSISIVLMILGVVLVVVLSINKLVLDTNKKMDQIDVFINEEIDVAGIEKLADDIEAIGGIKKIKFKSKDEGLKELKASWGEQSWLLDTYDDANPLPNAFEVQINNIDDAKAITLKINELNGVFQVNFFAEEIETMLNVSKYIKLGGLTLVVFLTFVSVFLISNTIKLAVNSRQTEISIMKYVGATNGYIKGPFIVEGVILGFIGSIIAAVVMSLAYNYFYIATRTALSDIFKAALVMPEELYYDMALIFMTLGVGIGSLGSLISLKKFLRV